MQIWNRINIGKNIVFANLTKYRRVQLQKQTLLLNDTIVDCLHQIDQSIHFLFFCEIEDQKNALHKPLLQDLTTDKYSIFLSN